MTKSDLVEKLCAKNLRLSAKDVEFGSKIIVDCLAEKMAKRGRIEIRGFGSFSIHCRAPRTGRNPKTGAKVTLQAKHVPHFKPGKELRDKVNEAAVNN